jgi:RNA recognition motif-containing protein
MLWASVEPGTAGRSVRPLGEANRRGSLPEARAGLSFECNTIGRDRLEFMNIYVGNIPFNTTDAELQTVFEQHGAVSRVNVVTDRETGRPRGFAFVEMPNDAEGEAAINAVNGMMIGGRAVTVNAARPREDRGAGRPAGGGGRSGGGRRW